MSRMEISFVEVMILSVVTYILGLLMEMQGYNGYRSVYWGGLAFGILGLILAVDFAIDIFKGDEQPLIFEDKEQ